MTTKIIKIGNSKGIRIPRNVLNESGLKDEVEIEVKNDKIILKPAVKARNNWSEAFQRMSKNGDDILLDKKYLQYSTSWDNQEWEW